MVEPKVVLQKYKSVMVYNNPDANTKKGPLSADPDSIFCLPIGYIVFFGRIYLDWIFNGLHETFYLKQYKRYQGISRYTAVFSNAFSSVVCPNSDTLP